MTQLRGVQLKGFVRRWLPWALAALAVGAAVFWVKLRPVTVSCEKAEVGEVKAEVLGTGTLEARFQTTVGSKIQGRLTQLHVDQNDKVTQRELLAQLDDAELLKEVAIARAVLDAAKATVERVRAEEAGSKAVWEQAQRDFQRYSALVETKAISQENVEKTRERLAVTQADVTKTAASVAEALRQVATAEERLSYSEARLADTRIFSPFDGLIVRRDRETGDIVVPGTSIYQLISTQEMWIAAWVDESAMSGLAVDQPARIVFRSEPKKHYQGRVARLGREVDRETREFRVDVRADSLPSNWAVGQRGEVYIETANHSKVLSVPLRAVVWRGGKPGIHIAIQGAAQWREIKEGVRGTDRVEVVKGLVAGDLVITKTSGPIDKLPSGKRIQVK